MLSFIRESSRFTIEIESTVSSRKAIAYPFLSEIIFSVEKCRGETEREREKERKLASARSI